MAFPDAQQYITLFSYSDTYMAAYWINVLKEAVDEISRSK